MAIIGSTTTNKLLEVMNASTASLKPNKTINDTQTRIVEAAITCVKRWGVEKVSLNDIAKEAGVTRPTVYSYFSNRDEVIQHALLQSAYSFGDKALKHIGKFTTAEERTVEAVLFSLKNLPKEPYLTLLKDNSMSNIINTHGLSTREGQEILRSLFNVILMDSTIQDDDIDEIAEVTARLMLSLLTVESPKKRNDKELRAFLKRRLLPMLGL